MTRFYLASRFSRHPEMRDIRDRLVALGHQVTARWIDRGSFGDAEEDRIYRQLDKHPEEARSYAEEDLADILRSDVLAFFVPPGGGGRGGRHVELGYALGRNMPVHIIGPRENVFHCLADVHWFPDVEVWLGWCSTLEPR